MGTTLTVDDHLLNELRRCALESGGAPAGRPYRVPAANLGRGGESIPSPQRRSTELITSRAMRKSLA